MTAALIGPAIGFQAWEVRRLWAELYTVSSTGVIGTTPSEVWTDEALDYTLEWGGLGECKVGSIALRVRPNTPGFDGSGKPLLGRYSRLVRVYADAADGNDTLIWTGSLQSFAPTSGMGYTVSLLGLVSLILEDSILQYRAGGTGNWALSLPLQPNALQFGNPAIGSTGTVQDAINEGIGQYPDACFGVSPNRFLMIGRPLSVPAGQRITYALDARAQDLKRLGRTETAYLSGWEVRSGTVLLGSGQRSDLPRLAPRKTAVQQVSDADRYTSQSATIVQSAGGYGQTFNFTAGAGYYGQSSFYYTGTFPAPALTATLTLVLSLFITGAGPVWVRLDTSNGPGPERRVTAGETFIFEVLNSGLNSGSIVATPVVFIPESSVSTTVSGSWTASGTSTRRVDRSYPQPAQGLPQLTLPLETDLTFEFWLPGLHVAPYRVSGLDSSTLDVAGSVATYSAGVMRTAIRTGALPYKGV